MLRPSGMRIAISGSHRTGKSTLADELAGRLPKYGCVAEPYYLMEEDGYEFAYPPTVEDFEAQLERSLAELKENSERDVVFDRCPLDLLAYLTTHDEADSFDADEWLPRVTEAMQTLDLVVYVPVESPDRITASHDDDEVSRAAVDEALREMLVDDSLGLGLACLTVEGRVESRVEAVLDWIRRPPT